MEFPSGHAAFAFTFATGWGPRRPKPGSRSAPPLRIAYPRAQPAYAERELDDVNTAIEQVLDGTAEQPRPAFRLQPAAASGPGV